jgi:hypothetical protein
MKVIGNALHPVKVDAEVTLIKDREPSIEM